MFASAWIAGLCALFLWWFSTGVILMAVRHADNTEHYKRITILTFPLFLLGFAAVISTSSNGRVISDVLPDPVANTYAAFVGALAIWGWIELTFLSGVITGPNRTPCPPTVNEWERFIRAWGTIAYHEILIVTCLIILGFGLASAPNPFAFWTFAILFFARISAKLNLFLGVNKINTEFLPKPLAHLPSHFRYARMNWLFPISITALTFAVACWLERIYAATTSQDVVGFSLLAALTALALLEHWFMVLPLPDEKLWRWMLPKKLPNTALTKTDTPRLNEEAHGL